MVAGADILPTHALSQTFAKALPFWNPKFEYPFSVYGVQFDILISFSFSGVVGVSLNEAVTPSSASGTVSPQTGVNVTGSAIGCIGSCTATGAGFGVQGTVMLASLFYPLTSQATLTSPTTATSSTGISVQLSGLSGTMGWIAKGCVFGACATASGDVVSWQGFSTSALIAPPTVLTHCL
jgi:hypothetical protein